MEMGLKTQAYVENYAKMHAAKVAGNTELYKQLSDWCSVFESMASYSREINISLLQQQASEYYAMNFGVSMSESKRNSDMFITVHDPVMEETSDSPEYDEKKIEYNEFSYEEAIDNFFYFCKYIEILYRPGMMPHCPNGGMGPAILNEAQDKMANLLIHLMFDKKIPVRVMLLKARQMGFTTVFLMFWVWLCVQIRGFQILFIIDKDEHMYGKRDDVARWIIELNQIDSRFPGVKEKKGKSILLTNGAKFHFDSAMSPNPGTSEMLHALHLSERPKWPANKVRQIMASMVPSIPDRPGTLVIDESTAEGAGEFKDDWVRLHTKGNESENPFIPVFIPWYMSSEYRKDPPPKCYRPDGSFIFLNDDLEVCEVDPAGQIILTEQQIAEDYNLDEAQVYWRRMKIKDALRGDKELFNQEYPTTPDHAWASIGVTYFSGPLLKAVEKGLEQPIYIGSIGCEAVEKNSIRNLPHYTRFENVKLCSGRTNLHIWEYPQKDHKYYVGADVSQGKLVTSSRGTESDWSVICVTDGYGKTVAMFRARVKPEELPFFLVCIGLFYNTARINCERNKDGETVWAFFEPTCYPNIYYRDDSKGRISDYAWSNVGPTQRNPTINLVRASVIEDPSRVRCLWLYDEMCNLLRKQNGSLDPRSGKHDDVIMARAHAERCRIGYAGTGRSYPAKPAKSDHPDNSFEAIMAHNGIKVY